MDDAERFPAVSGEALDGTPFVAPRDLAVARTVAFVGFAVEQRSEIESWVPYVDTLVRSRPDVRARLFVALGMPKLMRGAVLGAMRAAVSAPELRASTVPLFVDVAAFARAAGIHDRTHVTVMVVEPDGRITWRGSGPYSDAAGAALTEALR